MIELTHKQTQRLTDPATEAVDPATQERHMLVRKARDDRIRSILDQEWWT